MVVCQSGGYQFYFGNVSRVKRLAPPEPNNQASAAFCLSVAVTGARQWAATKACLSSMRAKLLLGVSDRLTMALAIHPPSTLLLASQTAPHLGLDPGWVSHAGWLVGWLARIGLVMAVRALGSGLGSAGQWGQLGGLYSVQTEASPMHYTGLYRDLHRVKSAP